MSADQRDVMVQLPMWVINDIREGLRLASGTWTELDVCVERSVAFADQVLPCDVSLPPGMTIRKSAKLYDLLSAIDQRKSCPKRFQAFTP
ncbi:hypothetical protein ALQ33_101985 [Pseudomonas syringae pv. philadelphi]|uniref:Uncharacterized protein n=1 Tax=Pseudomonas syringae pv. philadelphi TaxID=251706 RepID=A0A3M3ZEF7_9PSED|nr:hypothetical protein ALQ33_101985 [Pseudomonas syringae pv. philadelphi]